MSRFTRAACSLCTLAVCGLLSLIAGRSAMAQDLVDLVKKVEHAVVRIDVDGGGSGSGVIVDDRGFVFTNFHVIEGTTKATVTLRSGKKVEAQGYLAVDQSRDLALIQIDKLAKSAAIRIAAADPQIGEKVAAFGNPQGFSFTTSEGIVSAVRTGAEIAKVLPKGTYSRMGRSESAIWVQTTAPISQGNSGGPLVNMKGEVVGLNSWYYREGQNLNFAISAKDIRGLLEKTNGATILGFDSLPQRAGSADDEDWDPRYLEVKLPNGRMFSMEIFIAEAVNDYVNEEVQRRSRAKEEGLVPIRQANGTLFAAVTQKNGVLNGDARATHDNLQPMLDATYEDGKRQGILHLWETSRRAKYFAQYAKGRRHGFVCLFDRGTLVAIADYKYDEPVCIQLMKNEEPLKSFASAEEAQKDSQARKAIEAMDEIEDKLKVNDLLFRKQVAAYEAGQRKARAAALSPQKRDRAQARENARAAEEDAFLREMARRAWQK